MSDRPLRSAFSPQPFLCALPRLVLCIVLGSAAACARKPPPAARPAATPAQRLASADALVRAGCYDCLLDAYGEYDLLRQFPYARDAATLGAIRAAGLVARRQRELGLVEEGFVDRTRALATTVSSPPPWLPVLLDVVEALPARGGGVTRALTSDLGLARQRRLRITSDIGSARLREAASTGDPPASVCLSFASSPPQTRSLTNHLPFEPVAALTDSPLIELK